MLDLCLDCGRVSIMQSINPIANTLFYKEHITDTLDFLKQVYTPEVCDKLEADRLDDLINRDGCAVSKKDWLRLTIKKASHKYRLTKHGKTRQRGQCDVRRYMLNALKYEYTTCPDCCQQFKTKTMTVDHIGPLKKGGNNKWRNLRLTCGPCNSRKGAKVYTDALPF